MRSTPFLYLWPTHWLGLPRAMGTLIQILTLIIFTALFLFASQTGVRAEERFFIDVRGKVLNENNEALSGATLTVKGKNQNVSTNQAGEFELRGIDNGATLIISYVGYKTKEVKLNGQLTITINLEPSVAEQDEVVVIGYQSLRKRDVLGSVSSISAKDLKDVPVNSLAEALNGRLAGVTANSSQGSPDADIRVRIRGGGSITQDNSPLYIVDGVQVENGLNSVVVQDIQSIDVLKDASATAIYGARGANGVIIITTKSGRPGKLKVTYNGFVGLKKLAKKLNVLNPYEFVILDFERSRGNSTDSTQFTDAFGTTWDTLSVYKNIDPVNWQDEVMGKTGIAQIHNIGLSGGSDKTSYFFSYTNNNEKAIMLYSKFMRHQLNLKLEHKFSDKLKIGLTTRYRNQNVYGNGVLDDNKASGSNSNNRLRQSIKYRPFLSADNPTIYDDDPSVDLGVGNNQFLINPVKLAGAEYRHKTTSNANITASLNYRILKNLSFMSTFGYDYTNYVDRTFSDSITGFSKISGFGKPIAGLDTTIGTILTNSNVLTYSLKELKGKHDIDLLAGEETYQLERSVLQTLYANYPSFTSSETALKETGLAVPFSGYPTFVRTKYTSLSFFGRLNYTFMSKYLLSLNLRADASSKFAPDQRWGYFPSGSLGWRIKNENFLKDVKFINDLKVRAGYGSVGNNRINDYLYITSFRNDVTFYGNGNQLNPGLSPANLINTQLKWESTISRNLGLDVTLFNRRIDISVDVYKNTTKDLLLNVPIASTLGYSTQLQNVGSTSNKGLEIQVNASVLKSKNFSWTANGNISFNRNRIEALSSNQDALFPGSSWGVAGSPIDYISKVGGTVGNMYGWITDGFYTLEDFDYDPATTRYTLKQGVADNYLLFGGAMPGTLKLKDVDGNNIINDNDKTIIGDPTPKFTGGLNQGFAYKNWDLSVFINFSFGNDIYNANKMEFTHWINPRSNVLEIMQDRWRTVNENGVVLQRRGSATVNGITKTHAFGAPPAELAALNRNANLWSPIFSTGAFTPHSWAIEDGSFIRLNNVSLGYNVPKTFSSKMSMSNLRFYITLNNLAIITNYTGYDPEVSVSSNPLTPGRDHSAYPKSRSFIFGVNVNFK